MSLVAHETKWRLVIGAAPVIGVAFFVWAAAQGQSDVARSASARAVLAVVAALGAAVAWRTARQLRSPATVPVARAGRQVAPGEAGARVALRGRAHALPDAVPLISPDGELCLWFEDGATAEPRAGAPDGARASLRPFLLDDGNGQCIVLPAGAQVLGRGSVSREAARSRLPGSEEAAGLPETSGERLLRSGDRIHVVGCFVPASARALALQAEAAAAVARSEGSQAQWRGGDPPPFHDLRSAAVAGAAFVAAPPLARHGLALPVIAACGADSLIIRIGSDEIEGGVYGLLAVVDSLVLLVSSSLAAWGMLVPG